MVTFSPRSPGLTADRVDVRGDLVEQLGADQVHLAEVGPVRVPAAVEPVADRRTAVGVALDPEPLEEPGLRRRVLGEGVHRAEVHRQHVGAEGAVVQGSRCLLRAGRGCAGV